MSYIVGYGQNYPSHAHHRGASIASTSVLHSAVGCVQGFETWYRRTERNPNIIYGALVGGPDKNDEFIDTCSNYEQTEPTMTGTAPLIGLFSKLQSLSEKSGAGSYHQPPISHPKGALVATPHPKGAPVATPRSAIPVEFLHSITNSWTVGKTNYYRHRVIIKNISQKKITNLRLLVENLSGSSWGLSPTHEKNIYELPQWLKVLKPGSDCTFVYIQSGPQAKISVQSYN